MEIKWLEDFLSLAKSGSFSQSAKNRHVTQPAFSRRIKALESWLGVNLVDRRTYPVSLTIEGRDFVHTAEQALELLYKARQDFKQSQQHSDATISFAALDALSTNFFPDWYNSLENADSEQATCLRVFDLKECIETMQEGKCDFLLCYGHSNIPPSLDPTDFSLHKLATEFLLPVSQPDAEGKPKFTWQGSEDNPTPFLAYADSSFLGQFMGTIFEQINVKHHINTVYENTASTSLKTMAIRGYGLAWIPKRLIEEELADGDLVIAADEQWTQTLDICIYKSNKNANLSVEHFWKKITSMSMESVMENIYA